MPRDVHAAPGRITTQPQLPELLPHAGPDPVGRTESSAMQRVLTLAIRLAHVDSTVLISGENGVGKERLARWLHQASRRGRRPFVAVKCGAFADIA